MAQIKKIIVVCGEPSGDMLAAELLRQIKILAPATESLAVGGPNLREAGAEILYDIKNLAVMGFFDVLKKLPSFVSLRRLLLSKIKLERPDAVILVDFSGFNLRLAKSIKGKTPVIYYVSPQVWASRRNRIKTIKKYIALIVVLFKFEENLYKNEGVPVYFAGHPLIDMIKPRQSRQDFLENLGLDTQKTTVALLPGSRSQEVKKILPVMLEAARIINSGIKDCRFVIAGSANVEGQIYRRLCRDSSLELTLTEGRTYDCLNICDFALVCSGSATLEAALMQKPFLIVYKMGMLNYLLYRPQVKISSIGLVNIVAQRKIIPEFIQLNARPEKIAETALNIMRQPALKEKMVKDLCALKPLLGESGASRRAAQAILDFLQS